MLTEAASLPPFSEPRPTQISATAKGTGMTTAQTHSKPGHVQVPNDGAGPPISGSGPVAHVRLAGRTPRALRSWLASPV